MPLFVLLISCTANADRPLYPVAVASSGPYRVDIVDGGGSTLRTYFHGGRSYVMGRHGSRYQIRIHNPTGRRVEAVVSVDGLDSIDGETASFNKRGYVIPPGGNVTVEGFRVSTESVAAFRFSSVRGS